MRQFGGLDGLDRRHDAVRVLKVGRRTAWLAQNVRLKVKRYDVVARWSFGPRQIIPANSGTSKVIPEVVQVAGEVRDDEKLRAALSPNYNILQFLHPVDPPKISRIRLAAALSADTYHMKVLTPARLMRKYKLRLVTTSMACEHSLPADRPAAASQSAVLDGDGMTAFPPDVLATGAWLAPQLGRRQSASPEHWRPHLASAAIVCTHDETMDSGDEDGWLSALSNGVRGIGDYASKAAAVAATPIANTLSAVGASALPVEAGATLNTATISAVTAIASAGSWVQQLSSAGWISGVPAPQTPTSVGYSCPCHWFVADDDVRRVRHFVIQGTDCLDSWRTNVNFEPVVFEAEELGVKVHRGVYESAKALYERFEPLVVAHLSSDPLARVSFCGHSLGGALASVLALMLRRRGVISHPYQLASVYTFGTAAVFCEQIPAPGPAAAGAAATVPAAPPSLELDNQLLATLGLPESSIVNVLSTRDIVPRAFACDYSAVAALLVKWQASYAQHAGLLTPSRKLLYHLLGQQVIMQPSSSLTWVAGDAEHPLVPPGPGLWRVAAPTTLSQLTARLYLRQGRAEEARAAAAGGAAGAQQRAYLMPHVPQAATPSEALLHFMDKPHPLTILADPAAYGHKGIISRYHNPDNYAMALRELARHSVRRRLEVIQNVMAMLTEDQLQRSQEAWRRWLDDWVLLWAMCQQAGAAASEASALLWLQATEAQRSVTSQASVALLRRVQVGVLVLRDQMARRAAELSARGHRDVDSKRDSVHDSRVARHARHGVTGRLTPNEVPRTMPKVVSLEGLSDRRDVDHDGLFVAATRLDADNDAAHEMTQASLMPRAVPAAKPLEQSGAAQLAVRRQREILDGTRGQHAWVRWSEPDHIVHDVQCWLTSHLQPIAFSPLQLGILSALAAFYAERCLF